MKNQKDVERQAIQEEQQTAILSGIIDNEAKTYTFNKKVKVGGQVREGTFTAKYMSIADRLRIGVLRAKMLEGAPSQSLDPLTDDIAYMVAYLSVCLKKYPAWWNYDNIDDVVDLRSMFDEVYNFIKSFREQNEQNTNAGDSSVTSSTENVES